MADLHIRHLDDWTIDTLRRQASATGQELNVFLGDLLYKEAIRPNRKLARKLRQMQEQMRQKYGAVSDSTFLVAEDRDVRE
jgi:hypothetical protein